MTNRHLTEDDAWALRIKHDAMADEISSLHQISATLLSGRSVPVDAMRVGGWWTEPTIKTLRPERTRAWFAELLSNWSCPAKHPRSRLARAGCHDRRFRLATPDLTNQGCPT